MWSDLFFQQWFIPKVDLHSPWLTPPGSGRLGCSGWRSPSLGSSCVEGWHGADSSKPPEHQAQTLQSRKTAENDSVARLNCFRMVPPRQPRQTNSCEVLTWSNDHGRDTRLSAVPMNSSPESFWMYSSLWSSNGIYTVSSARNNKKLRTGGFYMHTLPHGDGSEAHRDTRDCREGWISHSGISSTCPVWTQTARTCSRPPRPRLERKWTQRVCVDPGPAVRGRPASGGRTPSWRRWPALPCTAVLEWETTMRQRKNQVPSASKRICGYLARIWFSECRSWGWRGDLPAAEWPWTGLLFAPPKPQCWRSPRSCASGGFLIFPGYHVVCSALQIQNKNEY